MSRTKFEFIRLHTGCFNMDFFKPDASEDYKKFLDKNEPGAEGLGFTALGQPRIPEEFQNRTMYVESFQHSTDSKGIIDFVNNPEGREKAKGVLRDVLYRSGLNPERYDATTYAVKQVQFWESVLDPDSPQDVLNELKEEVGVAALMRAKEDNPKVSKKSDFATEKARIMATKAANKKAKL